IVAKTTRSPKLISRRSIFNLPEADLWRGTVSAATDHARGYPLSSATKCQHTPLDVDSNSCDAERCRTDQAIEISSCIAAVAQDKCGFVAEFGFAQFQAVQPHLFTLEIAIEISRSFDNTDRLT